LNQAIPVQCMLHVFLDDLVHVPVPEDRPKSSGPRCRFANRRRGVSACDVYRLWWHSSRQSQDGQAFRAS
jgi:hypothetical protein